MTTYRIGTRSSQLAMQQSLEVVRALEAVYPQDEFQLVKLSTKGDKDKSSPLSKIGGKGVFVRWIEQALAQGKVDFIVHSLKDVPSELAQGTVLAAIPKRQDPGDVILTAKGMDWHDLPNGARVGTGSLRRLAQLHALRPDLEIVHVRGNIDSRLDKLARGDFQALVLATAGLKRLQLLDYPFDSQRFNQKEVNSEAHILNNYELQAHAFSLDEMIPAVGQGALAVQCLNDDQQTREVLQAVDDPETHQAVACERVVLKALGADCNYPVGAYGQIKGQEINLTAMIGRQDGFALVRSQLEAPLDQALALGQAVYQDLLDQGAGKWLGQGDGND
ncbi:hydroxymethylbilane synthase [Aerococcus sp. CDC-944-U94]|uniref:hydroxymethylbilane synthase n=1 Tax=Aerococcus urinae (strain CCUG 59500 / ACS-120-V-Col10a) TaxID=2976812 RepID=UPI00227C0D78|nr:hydroxymethylbilane synthase [Aerococcus sp. Group 1]MCY3054759.1 hydroxymethylbilane synthase [Aerococcus sp. Group 1]MCY3056489.1 hydroxymethylbilane synthase [Aerococcus sp. Group 1]